MKQLQKTVWQPLETVKEHFSNTANTRKGTGGQKLKKSQTDCYLGFWNLFAGLNSIQTIF